MYTYTKKILKNLFWLSLLLVLCSCSRPQSNDFIIEEKIEENRNSKAIETEYHDFFVKLYTGEEYGNEQEEKYMNNMEKIKKLLMNTAEIQDHCIENAKKLDSQFSNYNLGDESIFYDDRGAEGVKLNALLLIAMEEYFKCMQSDEENIEEIAIFEKITYDYLISKYRTATRLLLEKENNKSICDKSGLSVLEKNICQQINKTFVLSTLRSAYAFSFDASDKQKSQKDILDDFNDYAETLKFFQESGF